MEGKVKTCARCGGTGMVERIVSSSVVEGFEVQEIEYDECPSCNGGWSESKEDE